MEVLWRGVGRAGLRVGTGAGDLDWEEEERAVEGRRPASGVGTAGVGGGGCVDVWLGGRGGAGEEKEEGAVLCSSLVTVSWGMSAVGGGGWDSEEAESFSGGLASAFRGREEEPVVRRG